MPASTQLRYAPELFGVCSVRKGAAHSKPIFVRASFVDGLKALKANGTCVVEGNFLFAQSRQGRDGVLDALAEAEVDSRVSHYRRFK